MSTPLRWNAELYAANTAHHRQGDDDLLGGLDLRPTARVLDLGCGVGDFTARLATVVPRGEVVGIDANPDMVAAARLRAERGRPVYHVCRAQDLNRVAAEASFDLVVSRAVLHWVSAVDHPAVLRQVFRALRPGGVFRAEFGGHGQIAKAKAILDEVSIGLGGRAAPWFFPSPEDYRPLLADAGFQITPDGWVCLLHQRRRFPRETDLIGWLRSQVLLAYDAGLPADAVTAFRRRAEERALRELRREDGSYDQDYVRLDLHVRRPA